LKPKGKKRYGSLDGLKLLVLMLNKKSVYLKNLKGGGGEEGESFPRSPEMLVRKRARKKRDTYSTRALWNGVKQGVNTPPETEEKRATL